MLLKVLTDFEPLFDGTLGNWKTKHVSLQVKADVTPYHDRAYLVPKVHLQVLKKELKYLYDLGVLEWQPSLEWAKMLELMVALELIKMYLDDLLIISVSILDHHVKKLLEVFSRLQDDDGLKINANKSKICALETEHLGYIIIRDGIKLNDNKVQAILAINPPTNVKDSVDL